jgi:LeuA allosteric (dimerisation) domain
MSQKKLSTALLTANVFQNGLLRREESWRYYTDMLRRLPSQPVDWYISALDFDLAFTIWDIYKLGGEITCQETYEKMWNLTKICPVNDWILEHSGYRQLNFYDAIRLSCAMSSCVDAIVTWEPRMFAVTNKERTSLEQNGYFYINLKSRMADDDAIVQHSIGVFSVSAFLLHLDELEGNHQGEEKTTVSFQLEKLKVDVDNQAQATVTIRNSAGEHVEKTATGSTPCDALYRAIDRCIEQCILIPQRRLIHFAVPDTFGGTDTPALVNITVECDSRIFDASASSVNMYRAFGEAYVEAINSICNSFC